MELDALDEMVEPTDTMKVLAAQLVWFDPLDVDALILEG
jgi:hypothetical protein